MFSSILAATIWDTALGSLLRAILGAVGVIVLIIGVTKAISSFTQGTPGKGAKIIVGTAVVCAFMFRPQLVNSLIDFFATVLQTFISSADTIADNPTQYTNPVTPNQ
jgi:hypothetical protein